MYEILLAGVLLLSQLPNLASIYAVEIQMFKQKMKHYASLIINRVRKFYSAPPPEPPKVVRILYEDKYKKQYLAQPNVTLTNDELKGLKNNVLIETTPIGNVIMFYNSSKERFEYYSDKSIPYRFLESVSMKYTITFHCTSVYQKINTYLYLGKLANYSLLKKVDKHVTNKKFNVSFREFKNMKL